MVMELTLNTDEGLRKRIAENNGGEGSSVSLNAPQLKFKKPRFDVIRDFPSGCGQCATAPIVELKPRHLKVSDYLHSLVSVDSVAENRRRKCFPPRPRIPGSGSGRNAASVNKKKFRKSVNCRLDDALVECRSVTQLTNQVAIKTSHAASSSLVHKTTMSLQLPVASVLPDKSVQLEVDVDDVAESTQNKCYPPRPRVLACRDFPQGCGRNASPFNLQKFRKSVDFRASEIDEKIAKNIVVVGSVERLDVEPENALAECCFVPPRPRVLVCRDFPSGCGRNAAPVNFKKFEKAVDSSESELLDCEKSSEVDKQQSVKAGAKVKQMEEKIQAADDLKSKMEEEKKGIGDGVQVKSEGGMRKEMVEQIHVEEVSMAKLNKNIQRKPVLVIPAKPVRSFSKKLKRFELSLT